MEIIYLICALVGGTLIVCQFVMTLLGLGADHDVAGGDVDVGGPDVGGHDFHHDAAGHEHAHGHSSSWLFGVLTFRTLTAAVAFFGLAGLAALRAELEPPVALGLGLLAGAGALFLVAWLMRALIKLNADGTVRVDHTMGARGTVYLGIPGQRGGVGKVMVNCLNRSLEYKAVTSQNELPTGAKVVVVAIVSPDTVEVAPAPEPERISHV